LSRLESFKAKAAVTEVVPGLVVVTGAASVVKDASDPVRREVVAPTGL
jgi:hypothetical protein